MEIQPAIKKETMHVAVYTLIGTAIMFVIFAVLHRVVPEQVPFDWRVILGGAAGSAVAVLNFFLMGLSVQKVSAQEDADKAKLMFRSSYSRRMLMQLLWVVAAIAAPCFQFAAGIAPLFFPSLGIKLRGILTGTKGSPADTSGEPAKDPGQTEAASERDSEGKND